MPAPPPESEPAMERTTGTRARRHGACASPAAQPQQDHREAAARLPSDEARSSSSVRPTRAASALSAAAPASAATVSLPWATASRRASARWARASSRPRAGGRVAGAEEGVEDVGRVADEGRAVPEERVRALRARGRDGAGDRGDLAAELRGQVGGDERARPLRRLDDDRQVAEARDDPVARREAPPPGAGSPAASPRRRGRAGRSRRGGGACSADTGRPRRRRGPRPSGRRRRARRRGRRSRPRAPCRDTTGTPARARSRPNARATSSPYDDARRIPTIDDRRLSSTARRGCAGSPARCSTAGASRAWSRRCGIAVVVPADRRQPGAPAPAPSPPAGRTRPLARRPPPHAPGERRMSRVREREDLREPRVLVPRELDPAARAARRATSGARQASQRVHAATPSAARGPSWRKPRARETSAAVIASRPARSAIVRATRSTRWWPRALTWPVS